MDLEKMVTGNDTSVIELSEDKFSTFVKIAKMIGMSCADFIVKNSRLRQLSDRRSLIFDIPLNNLLGDNRDLAVSTIVNKIDLLDPWMKQQVSMKIITETSISPTGQPLTKYIFKDDYSGIEFAKPLDGYLNNETISDTQLNTMLDLSSDTAIATFSINKMYLERLYAVQKGLSASLLTIDFKNGEAIFKISSNDSSNSTMGKIFSCPTNTEISGYCQFPVLAFLSSRDEISGEILKRNDGSIVLKLETTVDEIPIRIWTISVLESD